MRYAKFTVISIHLPDWIKQAEVISLASDAKIFMNGKGLKVVDVKYRELHDNPDFDLYTIALEFDVYRAPRIVRGRVELPKFCIKMPRRSKRSAHRWIKLTDKK